MNFRHRNSCKFLAAAAASATGLFLATPLCHAAPVAYQTAVIANSPYVYYRFNENPITTGTTAADTSGNSRTGTYIASPTGGQPGAGTPSDNAVGFNGTTQYLDSTATGFGGSLGNSSYEFVFKTNAGFSTSTQQALFGVLNSGTTTAVDVELNTNNTGALSSSTARILVRDDSGNAVGYSIPEAGMIDGNYHDLIFTYNSAGAGSATAYIDGVAQTVSLNQNSGSGGTPGSFSSFGFDPYFSARNKRGTLDEVANVTLDEAALYPTVLTAAQASAHEAALVPEPASLGLLGFGALGLLARRRRVSKTTPR